MAQPNTINPYALIGQQFQSGLNAIIAGLPVSPTVDDLVQQVWNYLQPIYYQQATTKIEIEVKSVAYNAINSYRNNLVLSGLATYNAKQCPFIGMMIGSSMTANTAPDSFADRLADIEDNIGTSDLTVAEQQALFLAATTGINANSYWIAELANGSSAWLAYFSSNDGQNYMNTIQWSVAAMNGALAGFGAVPDSLIEPTTGVVTNQIVSALAGSLTVSAGKVIFNWIARITKPLDLNVEYISHPDKDLNPQYRTWCCKDTVCDNCGTPDPGPSHCSSPCSLCKACKTCTSCASCFFCLCR